ncbi:hypothetical protein AN3607.2 [Aspergillus nidulans FGSC A4]|uniref:Uncharacterized protein n=2 Tax=Emericella nidulans TaxID=162425 RepID=G5EAY0_EMENI|nr:protein lreB [Aspergillus nidulans FGSC A4]AAP47576.1 GATA-factor [Aspergillus nidulans]EAA59815.1 hypothetical protein AN3607.2 [Aspergillus nidulans FGSC A4]CBF75789.1 TPA: GATA-factorPutative uncharacterized protein; [Source:UniProtKB/TrEMBL;Acc:Q7ZA35] [Aspergillus nidulans FGSC A4]|eukprot:XP_661211.1 hypothetical protein AN3607.2 [Aspergillus nidulans FGSC A4]
MDPTHLQLAQRSHQYGLDPELTSASYGISMGLPQPQHSLLQSHSSINSSAPGELPWPQRILSEVHDLLLLLSADGVVHFVSPSCKAITGFDKPHLEHDYITRFIHDEDKPVFARELHESVAMARPFHCHFRMYQADNSTCLLEAHGHPHFEQLNNDATGAANFNQSQHQQQQQQHQQQQHQQRLCQGVFLVCRPYHNESRHLLDSFLEHKLENVRLKERIAQLKREEERDLQTAAQQTRSLQVPSSHAQRPIPQTHKAFASNLDPSLLSSGAADDNESSDTLDNFNDMDVGFGQGQARAARGQKQGGEETSVSHLNDVELLTGLHFTKGERAQGISTGTRDGRLYYSTTTNAKPSREQRVPPENESRKRLKTEYKCADCGTSDSPEWRKGPEGPKTLCNACGLRWAKMGKKRQDSGL